jgi:hypothetical protein
MRGRAGKLRLAAEPRRVSARIADLRSTFFELKNGVRNDAYALPASGAR